MANDHQDECQTDGADEIPDGLLARVGRVPARDFDVANAVEQGGNGQKHLGRPRGPTLNREVHEQRGADHSAEEPGKSSGHLALAAEGREDVKGPGENPSKSQEPQFSKSGSASNW